MTLTFDLQPAIHRCLSQHIDGLAGVDPRIKGTGFPDLQSADSLLRKGTVLGVTFDVHVVFHPDDLGLEAKTEEARSGKGVAWDQVPKVHLQPPVHMLGGFANPDSPS